MIFHLASDFYYEQNNFAPCEPKYMKAVEFIDYLAFTWKIVQKLLKRLTSSLDFDFVPTIMLMPILFGVPSFETRCYIRTEMRSFHVQFSEIIMIIPILFGV